MKKIFLFTITFSMAVWSCSSNKEEETPTVETPPETNLIFIPNSQWQSNGFKLIQASARPFSTTVDVTGVVEAPPHQQAVLTSLIGGHLLGHSLLEGQYVRKGEPLMSLRNPDLVSLQRQYLEVSRQLSYLKSEMDRQKILTDEKISAQKNYLKAKSDYETALASYSGLKEELRVLGVNPNRVSNGNIQSQIALHAPISGYISEIMVVKGAYVSPQMELLRIVNNDHLHLELRVFEQDAAQIKDEQAIRFKIPEMSKDYYNAKVHLIGKDVKEDRTVMVHAHVDDKELKLMPGMFVEAKVVLEARNESSLPENALAEVEGQMLAMEFVKKDNKGYYFRSVPLKISNSENGFFAIDQPLAGDIKFLNKEVFSYLN